MRVKTFFNPETVMIFLEKNNMTQNDLSEKLNIGPSYLSLMLSRKRPVSPKIRKKFIECAESIENRIINFDEFFLTYKYLKCDMDRPTGTDGL